MKMGKTRQLYLLVSLTILDFSWVSYCMSPCHCIKPCSLEVSQPHHLSLSFESHYLALPAPPQPLPARMCVSKDKDHELFLSFSYGCKTAIGGLLLLENEGSISWGAIFLFRVIWGSQAKGKVILVQRDRCIICQIWKTSWDFTLWFSCWPAILTTLPSSSCQWLGTSFSPCEWLQWSWQRERQWFPPIKRENAAPQPERVLFGHGQLCYIWQCWCSGGKAASVQSLLQICWATKQPCPCIILHEVQITFMLCPVHWDSPLTSSPTVWWYLTPKQQEVWQE